MSFNKKTVREYDLSGKKVLVRADYNVPIGDNGEISDDYRIKKSLDTLKFLLEQNCKIIICSHLGRPKDSSDKKCSLKPVAERLAELLGQEIKFVEDCVGEKAEAASNSIQPREVILLENLRYHPEEEANDDNFASQLAKLGEVFVQDGFGVVHRAHASTVAITKHLPAISGLLLENEVDVITSAMEATKRPLVAIVGGAKIADKIDILHKFVEIADIVAVGGAMANTFLLAKGIDVGKSLTDPADVPLAKDIIDKASEKAKNERFVFYLPQDGVVATSMDKNAKTRIVDWSADVIAQIESYPTKPADSTAKIAPEEKILDIGPFSGAFIAGSIQLANTVIWNGTLGVAEVEGLQGPVGPFAHGTELVIDAVLGHYGSKPFSLVGGGDTASYVEKQGLVDQFNHVSTGGGASLELMAGKTLPGVEALLNKDQ